jgi:hypothetical protein
LVERLAFQTAVAISMNERQKLGSRQGVWNDRIWVRTRSAKFWLMAQPVKYPGKEGVAMIIGVRR